MTALLLAALASAGPMLLDFGGERSPVLDGFQQATPWTLDDPRARWAEPPGRVREGAWPDALLGDTITGGALHLDLPPGRYTVGALFEDVTYGRKPRPGAKSGLRIDGEDHLLDVVPEDSTFFASRRHAANPRPRYGPDRTRFDRHIAPVYRWRTHELVVDEQGVVLEPYGAPLAALAVYAADRATAEVELSLVDARRRDDYILHHPAYPDSDLPLATQGLTGLEQLTWNASPTAPRDEPLRASLSQGERRSWLIAVHGSDDPAQVRVEGLEDLEITLHEADWTETQDFRVLRPRPHVLRPTQGELLADQGLVPLLTLTVQVPDGASSGDRPGVLIVERDGERVEMALDLRVRDLVLEPAPVPLGAWADLRAPITFFYGEDAPEVYRIWEQDVALMRHYGISLLSVRGLMNPGGWPKPGAEPPTERLQRVVDIWRRAGGGPVSWVDPFFLHFPSLSEDRHARPGSPELLATAKRFMQAAAQAGAEYYTFDEFAGKGGPGALSTYGSFLEQLDQARTGDDPPLAAAEPYPGAWPVAADHLDIIYLQYYPQLDPAHARYFDGRRATPRSYTAFFTREASGRIPWLLGTEAVTFWHYNEPKDDPYNDIRPSAQWQASILSPGAEQVFPTRRIEALYEGLQDQRYFATLSLLIDELHDRRRPAIQRAVAQGCLTLQAAASGIAGHNLKDHHEQGLSDDEALEDLRVEVTLIAETLAKWSKRQRDLRRGRPVDEQRGLWPEACGEQPGLPDSWRYPP